MTARGNAFKGSKLNYDLSNHGCFASCFLVSILAPFITAAACDCFATFSIFKLFLSSLNATLDCRWHQIELKANEPVKRWIS